MRDLEIRGAGNLLGGDQSGHIAAVGYDLYVQMVTEAVAELKGEQLRPPAEIKLDLPLTANLPADYVAREDLRLEAYRRLATVTTHAEVDDIESEWLDRYGPLPEPAEALLRIGHLRAECARLGVREVAVVTGGAGLIGGGVHGPAVPARAQGQPAGPADPAGPEGGVQGGHRPAGDPAAAWLGSGRRSGRLARRSWSRR